MTLDKEALDAMAKQIEQAKGKLISKEKVLTILHQELKEIDAKNYLIVDRIDGAALKKVINLINRTCQ